MGILGNFVNYPPPPPKKKKKITGDAKLWLTEISAAVLITGGNIYGLITFITLVRVKILTVCGL